MMPSTVLVFMLSREFCSDSQGAVCWPNCYHLCGDNNEVAVGKARANAKEQDSRYVWSVIALSPAPLTELHIIC